MVETVPTQAVFVPWWPISSRLPSAAASPGKLPSVRASYAHFSRVGLTRRRALPLTVGILVVPRFAFADRSTEVKARRAFVSGDFKAALALHEELFSETLHPVYLRNIGRCHQKLGAAERGIEFLRQYLAKGKGITPDERAEVNGYIDEMKKRIADSERPPSAAATNPEPGSKTPAATANPPIQAAASSTALPPHLTPRASLGTPADDAHGRAAPPKTRRGQ